MSNLIVYKDNYLIEASYKLTLTEQRLMLYCISKLNPEDPQQKQTIFVEDFVKQFPDVDKKSAYKQIKQAIDTLYERSIKVKDPFFTEEFRWVSSKKYYNDEGSATISFSVEVMPYLFHLEKQFTKYKLRNISSFKRVYSIRLYELLTQYRTLKSRTLSVSDLRLTLKLDNKFKDWSDFKKFVINPCVEEINDKSDLFVSYELIKKGRAVDAINFKIQEKNKMIQKQKMIKQQQKTVGTTTEERTNNINKLSDVASQYIEKIKATLNK